MDSATDSSLRLTRQRPFVLFWLARLASTMGYHMLALTIGWQVYEITNSAFDLGLVGLIQFVPAVGLTLLIGHAADRYDRRLIVRTAHGVYALAALMITLALLAGALSRDLLFAAVFIIGCARAFEMPTAHALAPTLVPSALVPRAVAAWTSANQTAVICGPALGGLIYAINPVLIGIFCLAFFASSITLVTLVHSRRPAAPREPPTFASVLAGLHYIHSRHRLLGVITLDLFVVILGGATALLPIYARDILAVGPIGLGLLRSAPAVGALITSIVLARHPVERHIGAKMFAVVGIYGLATIIFGISSYFPLSLIVLAMLGASDAVSIVIRFSLVQIETPDEKRGRVSAINYLFVGSSNTLGEFESGVVASWLGAVPSVVIGGIGSLLVAGIWMMLFPDLRRIDRFEPADHEQKGT
ncbi:MAG TPA: MFS transporter [Pseudolabrys sp.]|nr:MFS transporter [Pseudolabrys sp.]